MSLIEYKDIEQGSDQWLDLRRGMITASTIGRLITPKTVKIASNPESRALISELAAERVTGWTDPVYVNADMQRGVDDEPRARDLYSEKYEPVTEVGFMIEDDILGYGFKLGFSPDGTVGDHGLIEIKSRRPKKHLETILAAEVPPENVAQIQAGLLVSGRAWCDYISYAGGMPLYVKRMYPDERWFAAINETVERTELAIESMVNRYQGAVIGLPTTERVVELEMVI